MSLIDQRVQKAIQRRGSLDLTALREGAVDLQPVQMASTRELGQRRDFLMHSSESTAQAAAAYERIIHGNELQDVNYLIRGARAARSIGRITIREPNGRATGYGTGFLIGPGVLLTNNHVLQSPMWAERSEVEFEYERDEQGNQLAGVKFSLLPDDLFFTHEALDFSVVAVGKRAVNAERDLAEFGTLPLIGGTGKAVEGEWLTIIQHPGGELKQVCVRENRLLKKSEDVLWYSTDTLGGASGAPVFSNDWLVVALHHSGVPLVKNGKWQTIDGQDYDDHIHREEDIKWIANEGIRVSRIVQTLQSAVGEHPLIQAALDAKSVEFSSLPNLPSITTPPNDLMNTPIIPSAAGQKFLLSFDSSGHPSIQSYRGAGGTESATLPTAERTQPSTRRSESRGVRFHFDEDYSTRKGYDASFLSLPNDKGANRVQLPTIQGALEGNALRLLHAANDKDYVLKYTNMSLVMHKKRKFAIYSAANVDFARRYASLQSKRVWRYDPRISEDDQIGDEAYAGNAFDRGHLTRQEDMEYGDTMQDALQSTADTCHWTNSCTQHSKFNQTKDWWQGMERHILEYSVDPAKGKGFRAQIFTGPVFTKADPEFEEVQDLQIPMKFWKVCAAVTSSGKLFAVAYLLDQSPVIKKYGLKEAAGETPFEPYKLFQLPITELEVMIKLKFTCGASGNKALSDFDPLKDAELPELDSDQDGSDDRQESTSGRLRTPKGWLNLERSRPYFGA
jgi:endonuclease G